MSKALFSSNIRAAAHDLEAIASKVDALEETDGPQPALGGVADELDDISDTLKYVLYAIAMIGVDIDPARMN